MFTNRTFFHPKLPNKVIEKLKHYKREEHVRLNYQNAILSPLNTSICNNFESNLETWNCRKYDINSAFISCLIDENFKVPSSNICTEFLVSEDANQYFINIEQNNITDIFAYVKAFVIPSKKYVPYIQYRSSKNDLHYTYCSLCTESQKHMNVDCQHEEEKRGWYITCFLSDILFMKRKLSYDIKVVQLVKFDSSHCIDLSYFAQLFISLRKSKSNLVRTGNNANLHQILSFLYQI